MAILKFIPNSMTSKDFLYCYPTLNHQILLSGILQLFPIIFLASNADLYILFP
jgi:hypothetical protein